MRSNKTSKVMRDRIEKLIDIYCTFMFGVDRDAGWHAPSQLEAIICSSMIKTSGRAKFLTAKVSSVAEHQVNDRADEKMINEISYVRNKHYDFRLAQMLFSKLEDKQLLALLAERYLKYVYKREHTEAEISCYLETKKDTYRYNRKKAFDKVEEQLVLKDQFDNLMSA